MLIKINKDLFNITQRIKDIDSGYVVFFNTKNKKYEIHNKNQAMGGYCATIPYDILDSRTLKYLNETHVKNYKKLMKSIDENNKKLENKTKENNDEIVNYKVKEIYKYFNNSSKTANVNFNNNLWF